MNTTRTSLFLMANLGAEVSRIIAAQERTSDVGSASEAHVALTRAKNILGEIRSLPDMQPRMQELDALDRAIHTLVSNDFRSVSLAHLKSYFVPFALRLMATR